MIQMVYAASGVFAGFWKSGIGGGTRGELYVQTPRAGVGNEQPVSDFLLCPSLNGMTFLFQQAIFVLF